MSFTPQSTTAWLQTLPVELQSDIAASAPLLVSPLLALRQSIDDSPSDILDDATTAVTRHVAPLLKLISALEECPLSLKWSSSHTRTDDDFLFKDINSLRIWLIAERTKYPASPKAVSSWNLILSAKQHTDPAHLWQTLFGCLRPAITPSPTVGNPIQSTPLRVSSGNRVNMGTTHSIVDPALGHELDKLVYINTDRFFETYFPAQPNTFEQCRDFLREEDETWHGWPDDANQDSVIDWFCEVTTAMLAVATPRMDRNYYSSADRAITGTPAVRKKDILLYPTTKGRRFPRGNKGANWTFDVSQVLVVGELKKSIDQDASRGLVIQLAGYVRLMFFHQQNRRFVHAFTLARDWMRCYIFHRGGAFASERFSINADPRRFVDVVFGYANMTPAQLGYDTTLLFDQYKFHMDGCAGQYRIKKGAIIIRPVIASRGTTCWDATRKGDKGRVKTEYVLKDTWRNVLYDSEADFYNRAIAANVKGLVQVLAMEEVQFEGQRDDICQNIMKGLAVSGKPLDLVTVPAEEDKIEPLVMQYRIGTTVRSTMTDGTTNDSSTEIVLETPPTTRSLRSSTVDRKTSNKHKLDSANPPPAAKRSRASPPPVFNRVHTRILMHKGRDITLFTTPRELLLGLHDAIIGHRSLLQDAGILHRDISLYNIMLTSTTHPRADGMHGFLIDLDMAVQTTPPRPSGALHRTGTVEFMAIGVLHGVPHTYRHDLESFWYVFIWLCVYKNSSSLSRNTPLSRWGASDFITVARNKRANIVRGEADGYQVIEAAFHEQCRCFVGVADEWRRFLFPLEGRGEATVKLDEWEDVDTAYEAVLGILKRGADVL